MTVVLVTPRSFRDGDPAVLARLEAAVDEVRFNDLGRPLTAAELRERIADVDGLLAGLDDVDASVFAAAAPSLQVVARYGVGVDRVDLRAAAAHGVVVTATPGANARAVAEWTLALMLALCRPLLAADRAVRAGEWPVLKGRELGARTVGLLGLGRIGTLVAERCAALGCEVLAHDPFVRDGGVARLVGLEELAARAEVLSLHAPVTAQTRDVVDRALLARLPEGAVLVNTARGELVDEEALRWALDEGPLAAAALDALRSEPPNRDHALLGRDDVLVTPHAAPHTAEATAEMGRMAVEDLLAVLGGRQPRHPVPIPEDHV